MCFDIRSMVVFVLGGGGDGNGGNDDDVDGGGGPLLVASVKILRRTAMGMCVLRGRTDILCRALALLSK